MSSNDPTRDPVWVWGVPFQPWTMSETLLAVSRLIEQNEPAYFITANTHYAMLTHEQPDLREINARARFIVADGAPLVWASRRAGTPLPARIAGSDLIYALSKLAAEKGYRLFLAGGAPGVADEAARRLVALYPGLQIVGTAAPAFREAGGAELERFRSELRAKRPDLLIVAATMPVGERWLAAHLAELGPPVGVNLGAAIDFAAQRVPRAPVWMQRSGLEWLYRLWREPRRLFSRYARNAWFIARMLLQGEAASDRGRRTAPPGPARATLHSYSEHQR